MNYHRVHVYLNQNEHSLYLVMDFHPGGDLFTVMERREGGMNENQARFYLTEISKFFKIFYVNMYMYCVD